MGLVWRCRVTVVLALVTFACDGSNGVVGSAGEGGRDAAASNPEPAHPSFGAPVVLGEHSEIHGANGLFFDADDRLWVASVSEGALLVVDRESGETLQRYGAAEGVLSPDDVTIASDGTAYFTNILQGTVGALGSDGVGSVIAEVGQGVNSVTVSDAGLVYASLDFLGDGLWEIDPEGATEPRLVIAEPGWLNGVDFGADGLLYGPIWSESIIARVDVATGSLEPVTGAIEGTPAAVKFDPTGVLHAVNGGTGAVHRIDIATGEVTTIARHFGVLDNLAFDSGGRLFVSGYGDGSVHEVLEDGTLRVVKAPGLGGSGAVDIATIDGREVVLVADNYRIASFEAATAEQGTAFLQPLEVGDRVQAFALRADGDGVLVAHTALGVVQRWAPTGLAVDAQYAAVTPFDVIRHQGDVIVSQLTQGSVAVVGPGDSVELATGIDQPTGLAALGDELFVASYGSGEILRVVEGASPEVVASGLVRPEGIAALTDGRLVVVETGTGDVVVVDRESGGRTVIAEGISPAPPDVVEPGTPNGVAVGRSGDVYVGSPEERRLYRIPVIE